jgi:hypothetical protein
MRELAGDVARWVNVELPELQNTRVDLLGETSDSHLIHIELQSRIDPKWHCGWLNTVSAFTACSTGFPDR